MYSNLRWQNTHLGEVAEWSNAAVLKTVIPRDRDRGFESHPLLHPTLLRASDGRPIFLMNMYQNGPRAEDALRSLPSRKTRISVVGLAATKYFH
jgi:hypothetical protein